jgi:DnaJ-class molecular chaperone
MIWGRIVEGLDEEDNKPVTAGDYASCDRCKGAGYIYESDDKPHVCKTCEGVGAVEILP